MSISTTVHRTKVLGLYRQLLRIGKSMPTQIRSNLVLSRVRQDFRRNRTEADPTEVKEMVQLAEVQIDNLSVQRTHLTEQANNPYLLIPVDIHKNATPRMSRFMKGPVPSWLRGKQTPTSKPSTSASVPAPPALESPATRSRKAANQNSKSTHNHIHNHDSFKTHSH